MIQLALLFALGFLTAALLGLLLAPAVYRRIVRFAEDRLRETTPLKAQEVRGEIDMARANYAAETAKATIALRVERDKRTALTLEAISLNKRMSELDANNADLTAHATELTDEISSLRASMRQAEQHHERLKEALTAAEDDNIVKRDEIETLTKRVETASMRLESANADVALRDSEIQTLYTRISALREEREGLRRDTKALNERLRAADVRLARDEQKALALQEKLSADMAAAADRETALERQAQDIARLRARLDALNGLQAQAGSQAETQAQIKDARSTIYDVPPLADGASGQYTSEDRMTKLDLKQLADDARDRAAALSETLTQGTPKDDAALRNEVAEIAARMIALTAAKEGADSPIRPLLRTRNQNRKRKGKTLAARAEDVLNQTEKV